MLKLTTEEILSRIEKGRTFDAIHADGAFSIKIEDYTPFVCAAIHSGHQLREELEPKISLTTLERWYEEDPHTNEVISSLPIVLIGHDSRYEYDLNRRPETCVYESAWDKEVWKTPLTAGEKSTSLEKHATFYKVLHALLHKLEKSYKACVVYDIHSYNYKRIDRKTPVFNLGTSLVDNDKFGTFISKWQKELEKFDLPNIEVDVKINDVFSGKGYLLEYVTQNFRNTLVLATEIKKVYCNEETGESYPVVIESLKNNFKHSIVNHAAHFARNLTNLKVVKKNRLLSSELTNEILNVDKALYNLVKNFEILYYVNPVNIEQERKRFFASNCKINPEFKYNQLIFNPFEFKRKLYNIPVEKIQDISIQNLYKEVINAYADKIDMLASIGSSKFLYNSLRYFGEPSEKDVANARYLLYCPEPEEEEKNYTSAQDAKKFFEKTIEEYGFDCKIALSGKIVAKALVVNYKKQLVLNKDAKFSPLELQALAHHEVGVHLLTTINARLQPLNIFRLGLPLNTLTQEGLAVLSEYTSGNITIKRLKELGLRVLAINMMLKGADFKRTWAVLKEGYKMHDNAAFYLASRIFRGGGFTKDQLYLKGFREILTYYKKGGTLDNLLIGKTSIKYIHIINEMIERKLLLPPKYKTKAFLNNHNASVNSTLNYVIEGIQ